MVTKKCNTCELTKDLNEFSKHPTNKDGYKNKCKQCINEYGKRYREKNKEKELERAKKYYDTHKEEKKQYRLDNLEHRKEYEKQYRLDNKEKLNEASRIRNKKWRLKNKDKINAKFLDRKKNDPIFALKYSIRTIIRDSLKQQGLKKNGSKSVDFLGCTIEELKLHLESQFEDWMTWDNRGLYNGELNYGWDIDHIIPSSTATTPEELYKLNHYTNLQPLCSYVNRVIKRDS